MDEGRLESGEMANFFDLEEVLERICLLRPVAYKNAPPNKKVTNDGLHYGLELRSVENSFPELQKSFNNTKVINQSALTPILVKAIIELKERIEVLEQIIEIQ